jgi:LysR family glycine cleavage system transcriptional activator
MTSQRRPSLRPSSDAPSPEPDPHHRGEAPQSLQRQRMPPLNALRVFAVAARTSNLSAAAQQLHVSQSAVTRHIATLESFLGESLFVRQRHGVSLTPSGRVYARAVLPSLDRIARATETMLGRSEPTTLAVLAYTTFSAKWLIPRLPDFLARHPGFELKIVNSGVDVDFARDPVDVAIQFGEGRWSGVRADRLLADELEPVCSPVWLEGAAGSGALPQALLTRRLLVSEPRNTDWPEWLAFTGQARAAAKAERMSFSSYVLAWQAAVDGLGLAIGYTRLLSAELGSGRLVRPFSMPLRRRKAYWLVRPGRGREPKKTAMFREWLLETVRAEGEGNAGDAG